LKNNRKIHYIESFLFEGFNILLGTDHLTCRGGGYGFFFRSEIFFRTTRELEYLFFFVAQSANFFSRI